jgi:aminopeptidase N
MAQQSAGCKHMTDWPAAAVKQSDGKCEAFIGIGDCVVHARAASRADDTVGSSLAPVSGRLSMTRSILSIACLAALASSTAFAQRLSHDVVPDNYRIRFTPDLAHDRFDGEETIRIGIAKPTASIVLNAIELEIPQAGIEAGGRTQAAQVSFDKDRQTATLTFATPVPAGAADLHLRFRGILNDQLHGFYRSHTEHSKYAVTQFEPADARRAFPSFDQPDLKATFDISTVIDSKDTAISNGRLLSDQPGPDGRHTLTFSTSPKMSTYLVAITVGDFQCASDSVDGIPVRICAPPEYKGRGQFAMDVAKASLHFYNDYFGVKYPFGKLDITAGPDFIEGMENTASIFESDEIFLDPKTASLGTQQYVSSVIAHEIAHQWFGDLVTMTWWDNIWLNEGFASWMQEKPMQAWRPDWQVPRSLDSYGIEKDALRSTHPVRREPNDDPNTLFSTFDIITYGKTAAVIRSLEAWLGPDAFRDGMRAYMKHYAYGNSTAEDLWNALEQSSHKPVATVMRDFIDQPGIPLVRFQNECKDGRSHITLTQDRFYLNRPEHAPAQLWHLPVCFKSASGKTCELLTKRQETFALDRCEPWIMGNANMDGYYHSAYDHAALKALAAHIGGLNAVERLSTVGDEWAAVTSGSDAIGNFLDLVGQVDLTTDSKVTREVTNDLRLLQQNVVDAGDRAAFESWMRRLLQPAVAKVGWDVVAGETDEYRETRSRLLYALGELGADPRAMLWAREHADRFLADASTLDPSLVDTVLGLAARGGDQALFERFEAKARATRDHDELMRYLYALQQFPVPDLAARSMGIAQALMQPGERYYVMPYAMHYPATNDAAWKYLKAHWAEIDANQLYFARVGFIYETGSFCDAAHRDDIRTFFTRVDPKDDPGELDGAIERIDTCMGRKVREEANLKTWLQGKSG